MLLTLFRMGEGGRNNLYFKISKHLYFKKAEIAIFADIIKILTTLIITVYKNWKNVKINRNYVSKCNLYPYFLI